MKACKLYIDRKQLAEKLGVKVEQIVIGDIDSNYNEITFTVFIEDNANVKYTALDDSHINIRRQRLLP